MATDITVKEAAVQATPSGGVGESILRCVEGQEKLERLAPPVIYAVVMGPPLLLSLTRGGGGTLTILLNTVMWFIVARILIWAVRELVLHGTRRIRYERAAIKLRNFLDASDRVALGPYSWTHGAPGALAITQAGQITIADRSTRYQLLRISPHQVADVRVEQQSQLITHTRHRGGTTLGAFGKGFGAAQTFGGRSTSVTQTLEQFFLELRYQLEKNGAVSTIVVPGGTDRKDVEEICAAIRRLEA